MKILLLGAYGQVGWELQRALAPLGELIPCSRDTANLENPATLTQTVSDYGPDVIVNAAAYTAVDSAERHHDDATRINVEAVEALAIEANKLNALLVHYSTDYIFDGKKNSPYLETDHPTPLSVYGATKLAGEEHIRRSGCRHIIYRTSWVYGLHGNNFPKKILQLASENSELTIVADQTGAPTSAELIADVTALHMYAIQQDALPRADLTGTFHLTASGTTTWYDFARLLLKEAHLKGAELSATEESIRAVQTKDYPTPAQRPLYSMLDSTKLSTALSLRLPRWEQHATRFVAEILATRNR